MIQNIQRIIRVSSGINRRLNHNLQIWVNTYVNPAELGANQSRVPFLSCCWKELVFLHVFRRKARTSFVNSTRHVVGT